MRSIYILSIILLSSFSLHAQNITGIWRGTFDQNSLDASQGRFSHETYKYEVQIHDKNDGTVEGVTYSYLTTIFYGKASLKGRWDKKSKTLTIKETFLIEVKSASGRSESCLMTCYLDYKKNGKTETLIGTFSSIKMKDKGDCGGGTVYLEKVEESDFEKEDFLKPLAKNNKTNTPRKLPSGKNFEADRLEEAKKNAAAKLVVPIKKKDVATTTKPVAKTNITKPTSKPNTIVKATIKPEVKPNTSKPKIIKPIVKTNAIKKDSIHKNDVTLPVKILAPIDTIIELPQTKIIPAPTVEALTQRENKLVNKIYVDSKEITIEFYDNGEIDNDTISIYKDNKLVINHGRLSLTPIVLNLKFDDVNTYYELITVAENLGDIPPNTALMVINYGRKRQEVFLTSDETKNAKVIIEYQDAKRVK